MERKKEEARVRVRKVVIPVAGWGTRSLPASKNIPKEMLPIYDKPVIQHVVEEAVRAGIRDVVFVTSRSKAVIGDHFDYNLQLEEVLAKAGKTALLHKVRDTAEMIDVIEVRQKKQLGLGHAVSCARAVVGNEPFAVMVGDDFITGDGAGLEQLVQTAEKYNMPVVGVMEVPADRINRYGMVKGDEIADGVFRISEMVEKPAVGTTDARLAIVGRYVLPPDLFNYLSNSEPGYGGELQLTDSLAALAKDRGMLAVRMKGTRFDAGDWVDYLCANIFFGLRDESLRAALREKLQQLSLM